MSKFREITFNDADVVNLDNWIPAGEYNPHNVRPWLLHDHGFVLCVVFASNLQEALDEAVDENKLDRFKIDVESLHEREDYMTRDPAKMAAGFDADCPEYVDENGGKWWWAVEPTFLGNAGEPFDIESLGVEELPNPKRSFCAQFDVHWEPNQPKR
jgi:hypothetical protein